MKRKTSTAETRIYTYGCLAPDDRRALRDKTDGEKVERAEMAKLLRETLFKAHRYRNLLVEQARARLAAYRETRRTFAPAIAELEEKMKLAEARVEAGFEEIKRRRQAVAAQELKGAAGKGKKEPKRFPRGKFPELEAEIATAKGELKVLRQAWRDERAKFDGPCALAREEFKKRVEVKKVPGKKAPVNVAQYNAEVLEVMLQEPEWSEGWKAVARLEHGHLGALKLARSQSGLSNGTYQVVETAVAQASREAESPDGPRFHRYDGGGRVSVQFGKGLPVARAMAGSDHFLRIRLEPHVGKPDRQRALVDIRLASDAKKKPIWVTFPMILHRPLPEGAIIKWAWIKVTKRGLRLIYELQLTLELTAGLPARKSGSDGAIALHLAWRQTPAGLRVGYLVNSLGKRQEVIVDPAVRSGLEFCRSLRSIADRWFDLARLELVAWREADGALPEWAPETLEHLAQWRAHGKLARFARRWVDEVVGGEEVKRLWAVWKSERLAKRDELMVLREGLESWLAQHGVKDKGLQRALFLEWWRRKDAHLLEWESEQRAKSLGRRKNDRRVFAAGWASRIKTLVVDKSDLREFAKKAKPNEEEVQHDAAREQRHSAAPSELRDVFKLAFGEARTIVVDHAGVASTCAECGGKFQAADDSINGTCEKGHSEDRDANACRNMLIAAGFGGRREGLQAPEDACSTKSVEESKRKGQSAKRTGAVEPLGVQGP